MRGIVVMEEYLDIFFLWLIPNEYTLTHLHVALAHEVNHNVRFQFIKWKNDITLGEMMVSEGLAEKFLQRICMGRIKQARGLQKPICKP